MVQIGFESLIDETTQKCKDHFHNRLYATYLTGSIRISEAIIGESDLDYWVLISDELNDYDKIWIANTEIEISNRHKIIDVAHINVKPISELYNDKFTRFVLKYNSELYYGCDILSEIESTGADSYEPSKVIAKERLLFARKCLEDAIKNICPQCMDKIPENTYFAARKYARYFIIIEGAYYLMAMNKFETYKQERVIQALRTNSVGFSDILDLSFAVLKDPLEAAIKHSDYIISIYPFVKWMFEEIERA